MIEGSIQTGLSIATVMQITQALAPLIKKPVVVVKTHEDGTTKKVEVSFHVKLSFEVKEI